MDTEVPPNKITASHLGVTTLHLIAFRPVEVSALQHDDLFNNIIMDFHAPYQSVWLQKENAEHFAARVLTPKDRPPWHKGVQYHQPVILSLSINDTIALLDRVRSGAWLDLMDDDPRILPDRGNTP